MTLITPSPSAQNGWYGSNIFGAGGWGLSSGGFSNGFGGGFGFGGGTPSIQSSWGDQIFVPTSQQQQPFGQNPWQPAGYRSSGYGYPQGQSPYGYQVPGGFYGGGSALSRGYGGPSSPGSAGGGGPTFGIGGGSFGGSPFPSGEASSFPGGSPFPSGGGSPFPGGNGSEPSLAPAQESALLGALGSGGSMTPQFLAMGQQLGLSPEQEQAFASSSGSSGSVNPADLPGLYASETSGFSPQQANPLADLPGQYSYAMLGGGLGGGGVSNPYTLAQVIQSEAGDSQAGQFAVAAVLANRAANSGFSQYGDPLGQANAPGQFAGHLVSPSGPGRIIPQSQVGASAQEIAQALQNGTLGQFGSLGNALYFLAQSSPGGAQMAAGGAAPLGGGTPATNNVFSNRLASTPAPGFVPPAYTLGNFAQAAADPFGTAYGGFPGGNANFYASGFPILQSGANGYGYPAGGESTLSDSLLGYMGFNTNGGDYTSQLLSQMGYGGYGYGGGMSEPDNSGYFPSYDYDLPSYTYGNDTGNPYDYSDIGSYSPSYGADYSSGGGVIDLGDYSDYGGDSGGF